MEYKEQRSKAYKANITRVIKHLTCLRRYKDNKSEPNTINSRSNIKSRSKVVIRL
jgi:hypothetical protein